MFYPLFATQRVGDKLVYAKEPWYRQQAGERPESEPLHEADHRFWIVLRHTRWEWKRDNHDWEENQPGATLALVSVLLGFINLPQQAECNHHYHSQ